MAKSFTYKSVQILLASVLTMMINAPAIVHADDNSKNTNITYAVEEAYSWTIHSLVDFGDSRGANNSSVVSKENAVVITKNIISSKHHLVISLDPANTLCVKTSGGASLRYEVFNNKWESNAIPSDAVPLAAGSTVLTVPSGTNTSSTSMTFRLYTAKGENAAEIAGDYTGVLTYKAEVVADD